MLQNIQNMQNMLPHQGESVSLSGGKRLKASERHASNSTKRNLLHSRVATGFAPLGITIASQRAFHPAAGRLSEKNTGTKSLSLDRERDRDSAPLSITRRSRRQTHVQSRGGGLPRAVLRLKFVGGSSAGASSCHGGTGWVECVLRNLCIRSRGYSPARCRATARRPRPDCFTPLE